MIASGQSGLNSDVLVWDFNDRTLLYRFQEHSRGVACLSFSDDEAFLCTVGDISDKKMFIWDMNTGNIVANCATNPDPTKCITWGGLFLYKVFALFQDELEM